jgi:hypothetical protein
MSQDEFSAFLQEMKEEHGPIPDKNLLRMQETAERIVQNHQGKEDIVYILQIVYYVGYMAALQKALLGGKLEIKVGCPFWRECSRLEKIDSTN